MINTIKLTIFNLFLSIAFLGCSGDNTMDIAKQKMTETTVVNLTKDAYDEYIGRGTKSRTHMLTEGIKPTT